MSEETQSILNACIELLERLHRDAIQASSISSDRLAGVLWMEVGQETLLELASRAREELERHE